MLLAHNFISNVEAAITNLPFFLAVLIGPILPKHGQNALPISYLCCH